MKLNRIIFPIMACALTLGSCDDQIMEWKDADGTISTSDIPLELAEKIALYDYIKTYAAQYTPKMTIGLGLGADLYISDEAYKNVADANFQMFTTGNAMKHQSVVKSNGTMDFTTIDAFLEAAPADMQIYGHNFIWHTQQQQTYLKSLIAPEVIIDSGDDDVCENVVSNYGFEGGDTNGWTGLWGKYTYAVEQPGHDSDYALHFTMTNETSANYDCQLFWPTGMLEVGVTYAYSFWVKSDSQLAVQFLGQNASYGGIYKDTFTAGSEWTYCTGEFTYAESDTKDIERVGIQFGGTSGSNLWVDDFKFGVKIEDPMTNVVTNYNFEDGTSTGWTGLWGKYTYAVEEPGHNSDYSLHFTMTDETAVNYDCQLFWPTGILEVGTTYAYSFWVKSDSQLAVQFIGQNASYGGIYKDTFTAPSDWLQCTGEFTYGESDTKDIERVGIQFGGTPGSNLWVDDFKFGVKKETTNTRAGIATRASGVTYVFKTAEEKKEALEGAMEEWIKGMFEHVGNDSRFVAWDVINEPIMDGSYGWRGIDGFGGTDDDGVADTAPVEDESTGLNLNWADGHFYWGYYLGKEYAVKAFQLARQYAPQNVKLFVNDYNLETSPNKLAALIEFVNYIDANGATVDGIGTQMHVTASSITQDQIDTMFKTMAATGKLIRVTELDVALGTTSPSADQLELQSNVYQMIIESYKENIPEAQQSGITIWTLSDNAAEHEYWLNGDSPNLFDSSYARKHAYKGVCDGLAGYDISTDFNGDDWADAY